MAIKIINKDTLIYPRDRNAIDSKVLWEVYKVFSTPLEQYSIEKLKRFKDALKLKGNWLYVYGTLSNKDIVVKLPYKSNDVIHELHNRKDNSSANEEFAKEAVSSIKKIIAKYTESIGCKSELFLILDYNHSDTDKKFIDSNSYLIELYNRKLEEFSNAALDKITPQEPNICTYPITNTVHLRLQYTLDDVAKVKLYRALNPFKSELEERKSQYTEYPKGVLDDTNLDDGIPNETYKKAETYMAKSKTTDFTIPELKEILKYGTLVIDDTFIVNINLSENDIKTELNKRIKEDPSACMHEYKINSTYALDEFDVPVIAHESIKMQARYWVNTCVKCNTIISKDLTSRSDILEKFETYKLKDISKLNYKSVYLEINKDNDTNLYRKVMQITNIKIEQDLAALDCVFNICITGDLFRSTNDYQLPSREFTISNVTKCFYDSHNKSFDIYSKDATYKFKFLNSKEG